MLSEAQIHSDTFQNMYWLLRDIHIVLNQHLKLWVAFLLRCSISLAVTGRSFLYVHFPMSK